jgi:hypothetical protein
LLLQREKLHASLPPKQKLVNDIHKTRETRKCNKCMKFKENRRNMPNIRKDEG